MLRNPLVHSLWFVPLFLFMPNTVMAQSCGPAGCGATTSYIGPNTAASIGPLQSLFGWKLAKQYCCAPTHGCAAYIHCQPKPPDMHFPRVCGKAVCEPCTMEHFGYYNTCWAPWGFPPDYSHCPTPQLAAIVPTHYPKTQYFSGDPREQQPGILPDEPAPMKQLNPGMRESDKEKESIRFQPTTNSIQGGSSGGFEVLPTPRAANSPPSPFIPRR